MKYMDKKLIIVITIVLVVVLLGGFFAYKYWPSDSFPVQWGRDSNTNTSLPAGNNANTSSSGSDEPVVTQVTDNYLEVPFLKNLSDEDLFLLQRSDNYLALSKLNNICGRKETEQEKNDCLNTVKIRQVSILGKAELCDQVSGSKKDVCYRNMAFKDDDLGLCASIDNQDIREDCQNDLTKFKAQKDKNILLCLDLNEDSKNQCIRGVFSNETDVAYCDVDVVVNNGISDICKSIIYTNQAFSQNDSSLCKQIPLFEYKEGCITEMGAGA